MNLKIFDFDLQISELDKKVIETDDKGNEKLSVKFATFRLKLPEQIENFQADFASINKKLLDFFDYDSPEA